jgi:hypothetical protein
MQFECVAITKYRVYCLHNGNYTKNKLCIVHTYGLIIKSTAMKWVYAINNSENKYIYFEFTKLKLDPILYVSYISNIPPNYTIFVLIFYTFFFCRSLLFFFFFFFFDLFYVIYLHVCKLI